MASQTVSKIPVIDLSQEELKPGTASWLSVRQKVCNALEECGGFVAVYNKVSLDLHNQLLEASKQLFDLPTETKMKDPIGTEYVGHNPNFPDLFERLGIFNATTLEGTQKFTNLMWPSGNDKFCKTTHSFAKLVMELHQMVTRMVFENYGVEKYHESHMESTAYRLRLSKYTEVSNNDTKVGLPVHTDKTFTTIIHQNHVPGLEIQTMDGNWLGFEHSSPSSFMFMAGDAFMVWSNDRIQPCIHRVMMGANEARYSFGLATHQKGVMHTPKELVDEEHPLQYKPFDHLGYVNWYLSNDHKPRLGSFVKAYCSA